MGGGEGTYVCLHTPCMLITCMHGEAHMCAFTPHACSSPACIWGATYVCLHTLCMLITCMQCMQACPITACTQVDTYPHHTNDNPFSPTPQPLP